MIKRHAIQFSQSPILGSAVLAECTHRRHTVHSCAVSTHSGAQVARGLFGVDGLLDLHPTTIQPSHFTVHIDDPDQLYSALGADCRLSAVRRYGRRKHTTKSQPPTTVDILIRPPPTLHYWLVVSTLDWLRLLTREQTLSTQPAESDICSRLAAPQQPTLQQQQRVQHNTSTPAPLW
jgi:hypothetical protein